MGQTASTDTPSGGTHLPQRIRLVIENYRPGTKPLIKKALRAAQAWSISFYKLQYRDPAESRIKVVRFVYASTYNTLLFATRLRFMEQIDGMTLRPPTPEERRLDDEDDQQRMAMTAALFMMA